MTNEQKLDLAKKMVFDVWNAIAPDHGVVDEYYEQVEATAVRLLDDIGEMHRLVEDFNERPISESDWI